MNPLPNSRTALRSVRRSLAMALAATALLGLLVAPGASAQVVTYTQPPFHALNPQPLPP